MGHALRGAVTAWLALIALQAVVSQGGSGKIAGLFTDLDALLQRAFDPSVPAIPDRRNGATGTGTRLVTAPSGAAIPGAHPGAQINPWTGQAVGPGY